MMVRRTAFRCWLRTSVIGIAVVLVLGAYASPALPRTWKGGDTTSGFGGPTNWNNPKNWNPQGVPGSGEDILIPSTFNSPVFSGTLVIGGSVVVEGSLTVTNGISNSGSLVVQGTVTVTNGISNTGTISLSGSNTTASLIVTTGTLTNIRV
ncbi:hypothetical protein MYX65_07140 [Acidobacteria bacterium AH-259-L09]|nr:hypothetical protein [Acidobacteria bacterium AH-259-L09]